MAALPAEVRINTHTPFPALVTGTNAIGIGKQNGIWTVGLNVPAMNVGSPPPGNYPTDYLIVYDSVANIYFRMPINSLTGLSTGVRAQRSVTASPIIIASTDQILNCNITTATPTCRLPLSGTRLGNPISFKDAGGQFGINNLTLTATAPDLIDGATSIVLFQTRQFITLTPYNDNTNSGWAVT